MKFIDRVMHKKRDFERSESVILREFNLMLQSAEMICGFSYDRP